MGYSPGSLRGSSKLQPALIVNINILFGLRPEIRGEVAVKLIYISFIYIDEQEFSTSVTNLTHMANVIRGAKNDKCLIYVFNLINIYVCHRTIWV